MMRQQQFESSLWYGGVEPFGNVLKALKGSKDTKLKVQCQFQSFMMISMHIQTQSRYRQLIIEQSIFRVLLERVM